MVLLGEMMSSSATFFGIHEGEEEEANALKRSVRGEESIAKRSRSVEK